jgi:glycosyl transferase family 25
MYRAYVINLARARDRWDSVVTRLAAAGIAYERIDAVDGRALELPIPEFDEPRHRLMTGRLPIPAEIGCYLSHLKAVDAFLATDDTHALILEDDAAFDATLASVIDAALVWSAAWDVLRLSTVGRDRVVPVIPLGDGAALGVNFTRTKGAAAYMLSRRAARSFARFLRPMRLAYDIAFDLEYLHGLTALAVTPYPVDQSGPAPTQIQIDINDYKLPAWRYLTVFPFRAAVEMARLVMRTVVLATTAARRLAGPPRLTRDEGA